MNRISPQEAYKLVDATPLAPVIKRWMRKIIEALTGEKPPRHLHLIR